MARKVRHVRDLRRVAVRALHEGAQVVRPNVIFWDVSGGCENPYPFTLEGRGPLVAGHDAWGDVKVLSLFSDKLRPYQGLPEYSVDGVLWIDVDAPCRRCDVCLARRAAGWAYRAKNELAVAARTWFGTLTLRPEEHFRAQSRAWVRLKAAGTSWVNLSADDQFRERHREVSRELTLWLKRVRKASAAPLRYLLVAEAHKSGLPHYHVLVHEVHPLYTVTERQLRRQWTAGFSKFQLVEAASPAAWYVCKYLSKAALARVRASQAYGKALEERRERM